jgi:hypothetical protein
VRNGGAALAVETAMHDIATRYLFQCDSRVRFLLRANEGVIIKSGR